MNLFYNLGEAGREAKPSDDSNSPPPAFQTFDHLVLVLILAFGLFQFFSYLRAKDFLYDDVYYFEAARSLLHQGYYGFDGRPEANQPPGLSVILASLCITGQCTYHAFLRAMTVFETLGFVLAYFLLRRRLRPTVAAAICLVLASSDLYFSQATERVSNGPPYLCLTMAALLVARELENRKRRFVQIGWAVLLAALFAASLMVASAAMALLGAVIASVGLGFAKNRSLATRRLGVWLPALLIGLAVQGAWMHRKAPPLEWPVLGYPGSYVSQLKMKNGQYPELGTATLRDIPTRVADNALQHLTILANATLHHWIGPSWRSVFVLGPAVLILMGLLSSLCACGGSLEDWYFLGYEFIYLLWPWTQDPRFILPVLPLACLYLWLGGKTLVSVAKNRARLLGIVWTPISLLLAVSTWLQVRSSSAMGREPHSGWQLKLSFVVWLISGLATAWLAWRRWFLSDAPLGNIPIPAPVSRSSRTRVLQIAASIAVVSIIVAGFFADIDVGRSNLDINSHLNQPSPDVLAAIWISTHTDSNEVVMARHVPITYYYSHRHTVWFPPSTDSNLLMDGIRKHKINYVMVITRSLDYYLPGDNACFSPLLAAYPREFQLVYQTPQIRIFRVSPDVS